MKAAAAAPVAALLLLIAACAEDEPALEIPADQPGTTAGAEECTEGSQTLNGTLDVRWQGELRSGQPVTWVLEFVNEGSEPVVLTFRSGQDGDVVLLRDGQEAYRWSEGMFFTQAVRCRTVEAGATVVFELGNSTLDVEPGDYTLRAELSSDPAPEPVERPTTVL